MAAGRYTSPETVSTFFLRFWIRWRASLAVVVVLPAPCRPAMRMTAGGCAARLMSLTPSPMVAASSRLTMPTSVWPGLRLPSTSWPSAFSFTRAMKSRTTGRATSASSRAMRTSRSMSATLLSVMRAWPLMCLTKRESFSVRAEAMSGRAMEKGAGMRRGQGQSGNRAPGAKEEPRGQQRWRKRERAMKKPLVQRGQPLNLCA